MFLITVNFNNHTTEFIPGCFEISLVDANNLNLFTLLHADSSDKSKAPRLFTKISCTHTQTHTHTHTHTHTQIVSRTHTNILFFELFEPGGHSSNHPQQQCLLFPYEGGPLGPT